MKNANFILLRAARGAMASVAAVVWVAVAVLLSMQCGIAGGEELYGPDGKPLNGAMENMKAESDRQWDNFMQTRGSPGSYQRPQRPSQRSYQRSWNVQDDSAVAARQAAAQRAADRQAYANIMAQDRQFRDELEWKKRQAQAEAEAERQTQQQITGMLNNMASMFMSLASASSNERMSTSRRSGAQGVTIYQGKDQVSGKQFEGKRGLEAFRQDAQDVSRELGRNVRDKMQDNINEIKRAGCDYFRRFESYYVDENGRPLSDQTVMEGAGFSTGDAAKLFCQPDPAPQAQPKPDKPVESADKSGSAGVSGKTTSAKPSAVAAGASSYKTESDRYKYIVAAVNLQANRVEQAKHNVERLDKDIAETGAALGSWAGMRKDAEVRAKNARTPEEKKVAKSVIDEIIQEESRLEARNANLAGRKSRGAAALAGAEKKLAGTVGLAKDAYKDQNKFDNFFELTKSSSDMSVLDEWFAETSTPPVQAGMPPVGSRECTPTIHVWRPSTDQADIIVEIKKKFGDMEIPFSEAQAKIYFGDFSDNMTADFTGKIALEPPMVLDYWPKAAPTIKITAQLSSAAEDISHTLTISAQEMEYYVKSGAEILAREGDKDFTAGKYSDAAAKYWKSLNWNPTDKVSKSWVASLEKIGTKSAVISACQVALAGQLKDPGTRLFLKQKAIDIARTREFPIGIPSAAMNEIQKGTEFFKNGDTAQAIAHYEVASALAPWWTEPYYNLGLVYEYMSAKNSFVFIQTAVDNYDLFVRASPLDEPRVAQVRAKSGQLARLRKKMRGL